MRISLLSCAHELALVLLAVLACVLFALALPSGARAAEACPNEQLRQESNVNPSTGKPYSTELPDCRAYEVATPAEKGQANINNEGGGPNGQQPFQQASINGEGIMFNAEDALPGSKSGPLFGLNVAFRGTEGWLTTLLGAPQLLEGELEGDNSANPFLYFSPTLSCGIEESFQPLTALPGGESAGEVQNLYVWSRATDGATLVSNVDPPNRLTIVSGSVSSFFRVYGASEDCSRVVFATEYQLIPGAPAGKFSLYEWNEGTLWMLSVLPDGTAVAVRQIPDGGNENGSVVGAVASNGSRVFFTALSDNTTGSVGEIDSGAQEVFVREDGANTTEASKSHTTTPDRGAEFEAASNEGSQVFFLANYGLAGSSSTGETTCARGTEVNDRGCDLYDYDVETKTLTDLSADTNVSDTEGADAIGVLGISQDGSYVYFLASGQLVTGKGGSEAENRTHGVAGVYVWHAGHIGYVASIPTGVEGKEALLSDSSDLNSRVTPNGEDLLFTSRSSVTGYDNKLASGAETAENELYLYSTQTEEVRCISCDPNGARPLGEAETTPLGYNDGYTVRNLSEDGNRVFFTSADALAPQAAAGKKNSYEWERGGVGSCTQSEADEATEYSGGCIYLLSAGTGVLDASASGDDVFVTSDLRLVAQDPDGSQDVYDVKVDGGLPAPVVTECAGEECQGALNGSLAFPLPGSTAGPTIGNSPPAVEVKSGGTTKAKVKASTRAQKLAVALKACRKKAKRQRVACEAQVRKKYGAKAESKKRAKAKTRKSSNRGGK